MKMTAPRSTHPPNTSSYFYQLQHNREHLPHTTSQRILNIWSIQISLQSLNLPPRHYAMWGAGWWLWWWPGSCLVISGPRLQSAPSTRLASTEHGTARTQVSPGPGVTHSAVQLQPTLTVRTVTHSRAHTNIFSKVNILLCSFLFCLH